MSEVPSQSVFEVERVRNDFPIFARPLKNGLPLTYLDSGASSQKPSVVIDRMREVYEEYFANAYRGVYQFGARIDDELESARDRIRNFVGAESCDEIVFTSGTTMSINLVARAWGGRFLQAGDEIVVNEMEHHANLVPWQMIAAERKARLRWLPLTEEGRLDIDRLDDVVNERTRMIAVTAMSNVLGTVNPIDLLARKADEVGARLLVDGAQSVPHSVTDVQNPRIDFLAFSGHKLFGPSGIGVLYGRKSLLEEMDPFLGGGHMIATVSKDHSTFSAPPAKFEAGTIPITQAIGLGTAVDYVESLDLRSVHEYERGLMQYAFQRLQEIPGLQIIGPPLECRGPIFSFTVDGAHPEDLAHLLDRRGVFVRHGHHCTMPLHESLQLSATVRVSLAMYNTREDIDRLIDAIGFARQRLRLS